MNGPGPIRKRCASYVVSFFILFGAISFSSAEATKEIWSDAGFYNQDSNFLLFDGVLTPPTLDFESEPGIPEGKQTIGQFSPAGQYVGWGFANVTAPGSTTVVPQDFSEYLGGDIRFWLKSNTILAFEIQYDGVSPNPRVNIDSTNNQWKEITIPLSSFAATSQRLSKVVFQFIVQDLPVPNSRLWFIDHIRWTKPVQSIAISPASTQINPGQNRQFTAEGRNGGDPVIIYPTFSSTIGSLSTTEPSRTVTFSLAGPSGDGQITAASDGRSASASIDVTNDSLQEQFGVLSESRPGVELGELNENENSEFLLFSENTNNVSTLPQVQDVVAYSPEGIQHNKVIFRRKTVSTNFQGMAIQWGVEQPNLSKDMNTYHDGSIRFWFKGPSSATELRNKLTLGIRSINVTEGAELSSILLSDYVNFDNTWNSVVIPIVDLIGPPPHADISRMKVFFTLSVAGTLTTTNESLRSVFIDDVRWDTETPGPLAQVQIQSTFDPSSTPLSSSNEFRAIGLDSSGVEVDIFPSWNFTGASLGELLPNEGPRVFLKASASPISGSIRATANGFNDTISVSVSNVNFPESFNIFSDLESSGEVIISTGSGIPEGQTNNTLLTLNPITGSGAPGDDAGYFQSVVTLDNHSTTVDDAFAVLGFIHPGSGRYLENYSDGFIRFYVRSNIPLQISALSNNVEADTSRAVVSLDELGIPNSSPGTGAWQEVIVPTKLFQDREPDFDFSMVNTYFTIGAISASAGEVVNAQFDVDNVKWLSRNSVTANPAQIILGLEEKMTGEGVLRSFEDTRAVTYDQALAAMVFTLKDVRGTDDQLKSKDILDAYLREFVPGEGFFDEYNAEFFSNLLPLVRDKLSGPNAFILLAALHYAETTGSTDYDAMIDGLANWLAGFQDVDGAIRFGEPENPFETNVKSTEHNLDCYAAFLKYAEYSGDTSFNDKAANILSWLENEAWNDGEARFNVGELINGSPDPRKSLDVYSWAPLALGSDTSLPIENDLLFLAETEFNVVIPNVTTGRIITGVDFGRSLTEPQTNNDAVWLEGMGQMSVAYASVENAAKQQDFINEIEKAVFLSAPTLSQGISYATNQGTAFGGGIMNSVDPSVSSMAWYIFAKEAFNPFQRSSVPNQSPIADAGNDRMLLFRESEIGASGSVDVQVDASATTDPDGDDIVRYSWSNHDLGPLGTFTSPVGSVQLIMGYSPATLVLEVEDARGAISTDEVIYTLNDVPTARAGADQVLEDTGRDGTVNTRDLQEWISAANSTPGMDNYNPWADVNRDGSINVSDANLIIAAQGSEQGDPNWNPDADINGLGFEDVVLDAKQSTDYIGGIKDYIWGRNDFGLMFQGADPTPTVSLPAGRTFQVFLAVQDTFDVISNNFASNFVTINEAAPPALILAGDTANPEIGFNNFADQFPGIEIENGGGQAIGLSAVAGNRQVGTADLKARVYQPGSENLKVFWTLVNCKGSACGDVSFTRPESFETSFNANRPGVYTVAAVAYGKEKLYGSLTEIMVDSRGLIVNPDERVVDLVDDRLFLPTNDGSLLKQRFYPNEGERGQVRFHVETSVYVVIKIIHNQSGNIVKHLVNQDFGPGTHTLDWDGRTDSGDLSIPSVHTALIQAGSTILRSPLIPVH